MLTLISYSQKCSPYDGWIDNQTQIDYFHLVYPGCTEIEGNLVITGNVTNIDSLYRLKHINGSLSFVDTKIVHLSGLNNLDSITYGLSIKENAQLKSITGLKKLKKTISIYIVDNPVLDTIHSLESVTAIKQEVLITRNHSLKSLVGLNELFTARNIEISFHDSISNLNSLNQLLKVDGKLKFNKNKQLRSWKICNKLEYVDGILEIRESPLDTLEGFENLKYCERLYVSSLNIRHLNNFNKLEKTNLVDIDDRNGLLSIKGFSALKYASEIGIQRCDSLILLDAFNNLDTLYELQLGRNYYKPLTIRGFEKIRIIPRLIFENINKLEEISAFKNLESVDVLEINWVNGNFASLNNFKKLNRINSLLRVHNCYTLSDISILNNVSLTALDTLYFFTNNLLEFCSVQPICDYLTKGTGTYEFSNNKTGCNSKDEILASCMSSIAESSQQDYNLFPNPTHGIFTIESDFEITRDNLQLIDIGGRRAHFVINNYTVDFTNNPSGMYFLRIQNGKSIYHRKILKIN